MRDDRVSHAVAKTRNNPAEVKTRIAVDPTGDTMADERGLERRFENVQIRPAAFDPWQLTQQFQQSQLTHGEYGATASFVGTMRDFNENDDVQAMTLEHYPGMTESQLQAIIDDAHQQWPLLESLIVHRVGEITPGDPIVLVVCWSAHRAAAFDACRYLMEALKSRAPFWKKETLADNTERWVEKNTDGYAPGTSSGS